PNVILGTVHWDGGGFPASFGETTTISNATSEFHVYSMEWDEDSILISVDDDTYFSFGFDDTFPFAQQEFFFLLNIAMGGNLGGAIDPGFTESTMEIDYIRVYQ
ncbi:MAG: glycoside hydrolase family 16 protein, partial [Bacteroidia bacterium]|nr:glycoside hydrolase family 16 protein [Bacteroidia bacterium]